MCGIVGAAGNLSYTTNGMFRDMFIANTVRGFDSSGIAFIDMSGKLTVEKEIGPPSNLVVSSESSIFKNNKVDRIPRVVVGHARAATVGKVTIDNAHPFEVNHIVGVHNGSLVDWDDLEGSSKEDVDSKAIFNHIAKHGIKDTWLAFSGAAALAWLDAKEQTLSLIRNSERDLYMAYSPKEDALFFASERNIIHWASLRNKVGLKDDKGSPVIKLLDENVVYTFKPTNGTCPLVSQDKLETRKKVYPNYSNYNSPNFFSNLNSRYNSPKSEYNPPKSGFVDFDKVNWALGEKADKSFRGAEGTLLYEACFPASVANMYGGWRFFVGKVPLEDDTNMRLEVFAPNEKDHIKWLNIINTARSRNYGMVNIPISLSYRPRITKDGRGEECLRISTAGLRLLDKSLLPKVEESSKKTSIVQLFKLKDKMVTKEQFLPELAKITGSTDCIWCASPITPEDHEDITWYGGKSCLCPECSKDETVVEEIKQYLNTY